MFIIVKKQTVLAAVLALVTLSSAIVLMSPIVSKPVSGRIGRTVVIDAGHGGVDVGVVGRTSGAKESDINLEIARALKSVLADNGYTVVMTRDSGDGLYGLSSKNRKLKDMQTRKSIIDNAKADIVVSIHQNYYPLSSVRGAQVFYAKDSDDARAMAEEMQRMLNVNLDDCSRSAMQGDYYILSCSETPALLIECGFLSSPEDEKLLLSPEYRKKIAYTIYCGITSIVGASRTDHGSHE